MPCVQTAEFEALYRDCAGAIFTFVAGMLRDRSAAEEVTATAFERGFRAREPFLLRYTAPRAGAVFVSLSGLDGGSATTTRRVELPAGTGRLRIATDALHGGRYALVVSLPSGQSALRSTVHVL
jgi:hypothetical protein